METPFHAACERGSVELIRYLLNNGADPNILPMTVRAALLTPTAVS
jgi:ankyrin repeat protein